jgi:NAD-dependent deacetylase
LKLAELEQAGRLTAVVTQNIDGLHQAGGSVNVIELHGSVHRNHCRQCGQAFTMEQIYEAPGVPRCGCGGLIDPSVVLYEDPLDQDVIQAAVQAISTADMLIIGGTSLVVYQAAGLVDYFRGDHLAVINKSGAGPMRGGLGLNPLVITEPIGQVLGAINVTQG